MDPVREEKAHFDQLSAERQQHGYIPDLDRMTDWYFFYRGPLGRKPLANLSLRRHASFFISKLQSVLGRGAQVQFRDEKRGVPSQGKIGQRLSPQRTQVKEVTIGHPIQI